MAKQKEEEEHGAGRAELRRPRTGRVRGKSTTKASEGAATEVESTTSSTHLPALRQSYTSLLPGDSSDAEPDPEPLRISSIEGGSVHQLESLESSGHHVPVRSCSPSAMSWSNSPIIDLLASLIAKGDAGEKINDLICT